MDSEAIIIDGLCLGDEKAYKYLYDTHYRMLCVLAYAYVHDFAAAEMIVSDVIFTLWTVRDRLVIHQSLRSYLVKAVKNRCINYQKRQAKQEELTEETGYLSAINLQKDDEAHPLSILIEKELDFKINQSITALPPLTRTIFGMSRFNQMTYEEISHELHVSVDVVKYHIKSALSRLRIELKDYLISLIFLFVL